MDEIKSEKVRDEKGFEIINYWKYHSLKEFAIYPFAIEYHGKGQLFTEVSSFGIILMNFEFRFYF